MRNVALLERIVSGEESPANLPQDYKGETWGFRGDPDRIDALWALEQLDASAAYRPLVRWVIQIGEQIRSRTADPHWTTCTDTLKTLSEYFSKSSSHPDFLGDVIPALEEIAKERGVEWSGHYEYQYLAIELLGKMAKEGTYASDARESLKNVRDATNVSLSKRVYARNILAHYEGFEHFWNTYACTHDVGIWMRSDAEEIQVLGKYMSKEVRVADFFRGIGEEDIHHLCFVAGITAYNEMQIQRPINLKEGEDMTCLPESEIVDKIVSVACDGVHIIERELATGNIHNHAWSEAARISNTDPARLQERYQTTIRAMRTAEV